MFARPRTAAMLLVIFGARLAGAEFYYVSPSGSDAATGTAEAPWRTIAHAAAVLQAGDTARILAGVYSGKHMPEELDCPFGTPDCSIGAIKPRNSGQGGAPIVFEAWPPGAAVI